MESADRRARAIIVLDTNVLIPATLFEGSLAHKLLEELGRSKAKIFCSEEIMLEYETRVKRDFVDGKRLAGLGMRLPLLVAKIRNSVAIVETGHAVRACRDLQDNKILECAVASSAGYLVSYDKDLLCLGKYGRALIVHPKEMLRLLSRKKEK